MAHFRDIEVRRFPSPEAESHMVRVASTSDFTLLQPRFYGLPASY
jgi:hypothetical protein